MHRQSPPTSRIYLEVGDHRYAYLAAATAVAKLMAVAVAAHEDVYPVGLVPETHTFCSRSSQVDNFFEDPDPEGPARG